MRIRYTGPGQAQFASQAQVAQFAANLLAQLPARDLDRQVSVMLETAEFLVETMTIRECLEKMKSHPHMEYCLTGTSAPFVIGHDDAAGDETIAASVEPGRYLISVLMGWDGEKFTKGGA